MESAKGHIDDAAGLAKPMPKDNADTDIDVCWHDIVVGIRDEYLDERQSYPWVIGFSGGKDSTVVAHGVFEALLSIPPSQRNRLVYVLSNDTMVESPLVIAHLNEVTQRIKQAAINLDLPITVARTHPEPDKTFWVQLSGAYS